MSGKSKGIVGFTSKTAPGSGLQAVGCGLQTVGCGLWTVGCELWAVGCGLQALGCELWAVDCGLQGVGCGLWAVGCRLQAPGCGLRAVDCGLQAVGCGLWALGCGLWAPDCGLRARAFDSRALTLAPTPSLPPRYLTPFGKVLHMSQDMSQGKEKGMDKYLKPPAPLVLLSGEGDVDKTESPGVGGPMGESRSGGWEPSMPQRRGFSRSLSLPASFPLDKTHCRNPSVGK